MFFYTTTPPRWKFLRTSLLTIYSTRELYNTDNRPMYTLKFYKPYKPWIKITTTVNIKTAKITSWTATATGWPDGGRVVRLKLTERRRAIDMYDLADVAANRGHLACGGHAADDLNQESSLIRGDWQSPRLTVLCAFQKKRVNKNRIGA